MAAGRTFGHRHKPLVAAWFTTMVLVAVSMLAAGCGSAGDSSTDGGEVVVMAASSLAGVIEAIIEGRADVTPVIAGSSTLVSQLAAGAEADVLITANAATMDRAIADGSVHGEPVVIATNSLVLATPADNPGRVTRLADLSRRDLLVGLCAIEIPCGTLAQAALAEAGIAPSVDTLEPNVRALAAKLTLGELDAGLVYRTDAGMAGLPTVDAPELSSHVNRYYVASVSAEPVPSVRAVVDAFTEAGSVGAEALHAYGFGPP